MALAVISVAYVDRERLHFLSKCYLNGNNLLGCSCTFSALPKLSANYQDLAKSWAIDPDGVYARSVLYAAAAETLRATTGLSKELLGKATDTKTYSSWLRAAAQSVGWPQTRQVIEGVAQVLATTKAATTVIVPVVLVGAELQGARGTMREYCGVSPHFLTPIDKISAAIVRTASDSSKWVVDGAVAISGTVSGAVIGGGNALTAFGRMIGGWFGVARTNDAGTTIQEEKKE